MTSPQQILESQSDWTPQHPMRRTWWSDVVAILEIKKIRKQKIFNGKHFDNDVTHPPAWARAWLATLPSWRPYHLTDQPLRIPTHHSGYPGWRSGLEAANQKLARHLNADGYSRTWFNTSFDDSDCVEDVCSVWMSVNVHSNVHTCVTEPWSNIVREVEPSLPTLRCDGSCEISDNTWKMSM